MHECFRTVIQALEEPWPILSAKPGELLVEGGRFKWDIVLEEVPSSRPISYTCCRRIDVTAEVIDLDDAPKFSRILKSVDKLVRDTALGMTGLNTEASEFLRFSRMCRSYFQQVNYRVSKRLVNAMSNRYVELFVRDHHAWLELQRKIEAEMRNERGEALSVFEILGLRFQLERRVREIFVLLVEVGGNAGRAAKIRDRLRHHLLEAHNVNMQQNAASQKPDQATKSAATA